MARQLCAWVAGDGGQLVTWPRRPHIDGRPSGSGVRPDGPRTTPRRAAGPPVPRGEPNAGQSSRSRGALGTGDQLPATVWCSTPWVFVFNGTKFPPGTLILPADIAQRIAQLQPREFIYVTSGGVKTRDQAK